MSITSMRIWKILGESKQRHKFVSKQDFFLFQVPSISSAVHFAKMVIKCKCIHSYPLNITGEKKYCVPLERETRLMCATAIFEPNSIIISNNLRAIKSSILIDSNRTFSITADAFTS